MATNNLSARKSVSSSALLAGCAKQALAAALVTCASFAALAGSVTVNGSTSGAPVWNRTTAGAPPTGLSGVGTAVPFLVTAFHVTADGSYQLDNQANYDTYLHLYQSAFDPLAQFTNVIAANDDFGGSLSSQLTSNLLAGTNYFAVTSGFGNSDFGAFALTISGPGAVNLSTRAQVPEPTSLALAGLALLGLVATRKRQSV